MVSIGGFLVRADRIDNRVFASEPCRPHHTASHSIDFVSLPKAGHARTDGLDDAARSMPRMAGNGWRA